MILNSPVGEKRREVEAYRAHEHQEEAERANQQQEESVRAAQLKKQLGTAHLEALTRQGKEAEREAEEERAHLRAVRAKRI